MCCLFFCLRRQRLLCYRTDAAVVLVVAHFWNKWVMSYSPKIESLLWLFENQTPFLRHFSWSFKTSLKFFSEFKQFKIHSVRMTRVEAQINKWTPEVYCWRIPPLASLASLLLVTVKNYWNISLVFLELHRTQEPFKIFPTFFSFSLYFQYSSRVYNTKPICNKCCFWNQAIKLYFAMVLFVYVSSSREVG